MRAQKDGNVPGRIRALSLGELSDWLREKYWITRANAKTISRIAKQPIPSVITVRDKYWYTRKGAVNGGIASYAKYKFGNDEVKRKAAWETWWETKGKKNAVYIGQTKAFSIPRKSKDLAEFVGIVLGDGGLTKYQCNITLNKKTDHEYSLYVKKLIKKLFDVEAERYGKGETLGENISINRKGVVDFLVSIGLRTGNKLAQGIEIPSWILGNKEYERMCVRGLIDTDGSLIKETHAIRGEKYTYGRINFTTASLPFAYSVLKILEDNNLEPKLRRAGQSVQVENKEKICQYFKTIGTSNPKHLNRWKSIDRRDV